MKTSISLSKEKSLPKPSKQKTNHIYLIEDMWDDWGKYQTQFSVCYIDKQGKEHFIGSTKIGQKDLKPANSSEAEKNPQGYRKPNIDEDETYQLEKIFFSLGQSEDYYENLYALEGELGKATLQALNDCAFDLGIFRNNLNEEVMRESLLRSVSKDVVERRYHFLSQGKSELTPYSFSYIIKSKSTENDQKIDFSVTPQSSPPTNIHVIIGRNGVGKTRCIKSIAIESLKKESTLLLKENTEHKGKLFKSSFSGMVFCSFSIFDNLKIKNEETASIKFSQIGLSEMPDEKDINGKKRIPERLSEKFYESLWECRSGTKRKRWRECIKSLESDPLLQEINLSGKFNINGEESKKKIIENFSKLSSGHAIVAFTITKLVELVEEKTLVILDEPEVHLHPPLLSAFIRTLNDLMIQRNGVAIIATHSPVVLQEIPKKCVWKLRRSGSISIAERPRIETFGENVGALTHEVFGLEVTKSGFHNLIKQAVNNCNSYEEVLESFDHQLGLGAQSIAKVLIAGKNFSD